MNKTLLIIQREYLSRVKKKSFVVMSILGPVLFASMFVLPALFASLSDSGKSHIAVIDESGKYTNALVNSENITFSFLPAQERDALKSNYETKGFSAFLIVSDDLEKNKDAAKIYSNAQITIDTKSYISNCFVRFIEKERLNSYAHIDSLQQIIQHINNVQVHVSTIKLDDSGQEKEGSAEITMIAALVFAMLIYFFVLLYGTQVMRGVMEEKTNRIVEVIVSSVKPFQLMMGKVIGIAGVALTQFLIWVILTITLVAALSQVFDLNDVSGMAGTTGVVASEIQSIPAAQPENNEFAVQFNQITNNILSLNLVGSLLAFVFYFLGGYLLYASIFAAIGSALDSNSDGQQFVTPVMMPLILSIYIAMAAFRDPGGSIAFWFSLFPLTSPVVMMARIPFQVPLWEILLSMIILTASFIASIWFSARIYRTGILMYGKETTYKEMWKWFKQAGK